MIFWGHRVSGKTTLARLMATAFKSEFIALSAVFLRVKDIRLQWEQAQQNLPWAEAHDLVRGRNSQVQ